MGGVEKYNFQIYEKCFDHLRETHANVYKEFCQKYLPEIAELLDKDMLGTECAELLARYGHLSYNHFDSYIVLFVPNPDYLSDSQKSWLKENYVSLNSSYMLDTCICTKENGHYSLKKYPYNSDYPEKRKIPVELEDIISEENKKIGR